MSAIGSTGPLATLGERIGRHAGIYASGNGITLLVGLASVAALTRFLPPEDYGRLGVLLVFAAGLTILYSLGALQGSFSWVFMGSDEDVAAGENEDVPTAGDKRAALGTALLYFVGLAAAGTLLAWLAAPALASFLLGDGDDQDAVVYAALAGGLGAVWRLVQNVPRLERRPLLHTGLGALQAVAVLGLSILFVANGGGVEGALLGTAAGTGASTLIGLAITWRSYRVAFKLHDLRQIMHHGKPIVPIIVSFWILNQFDVFLLSRYVSDDEVAFYRVAARVAAVLSYFVSAFLMAWMPLSRTSVARAVMDERGRPAMHSIVITYFVIAIVGMLLALTLTSGALVKIAASSYGEAAELIPIIAVAILGHGCFLVLYRLSSFPRRRLAYILLAVASAGVFNGAALLLIPVLGTYGAAFALIIGNFAGPAGLLFFSQRGPEPVPFEYARLAAVAAIGCACLAVGVLGGELAGDFAPGVIAVVLLAYPVLLVVTGTIPPEHLQPLRGILRSVLPQRRQVSETGGRLRRLDPADLASLEILLRHRLLEDDVAEVASVHTDAIRIRAVRALRHTLGMPPAPTEHDAAIGAYLLSRESVAERDAAARTLWKEGADPEELDHLESLVRELVRAPELIWGANGRRRILSDRTSRAPVARPRLRRR